jgi:hypothetical protein
MLSSDEISFPKREEGEKFRVMSVKLGDKHPSYSSQKLGLLDLEQTI